MSSKLPSTLLSTSSTAYASFKPTFLSLRVLQSQCPPQNPTRPPLHFLIPALQPRPLVSHRQTAFSTTAYREKKSGGKRDSKRPPPNLPASKEAVDIDDLSEYKDAIGKAHDHLKNELAKVQPGGFVRDLEALEGLRVQLEKGGRNGSKGSAKLGDLGQVLPRGKTVIIIVGEKDHVKDITSTLSQPPHNLNAQLSPTEPLKLTIPLPPITQESRQEAAKIAEQKGEAALFALREARGARRKYLQKLAVGKLILPDELRRAERELDKVNEVAVAQAKKMVEDGKRRVMGQ